MSVDEIKDHVTDLLIPKVDSVWESCAIPELKHTVAGADHDAVELVRWEPRSIRGGTVLVRKTFALSRDYFITAYREIRH